MSIAFQNARTNMFNFVRRNNTSNSRRPLGIMIRLFSFCLVIFTLAIVDSAVNTFRRIRKGRIYHEQAE